MTTKYALVLAVGVIGIGGVLWVAVHSRSTPTRAARGIPHSTTHKPMARNTMKTAAAPPLTASSSPPVPVLPPRGAARGSAITSYEVISHNAAPPVTNPILTAPVPWQTGATWAVVPEAVKKTLWFGEQKTPGGPWTWIPSTLPGALSPQLPRPIYQALAWAYDLHVGQSGPNLGGTVSWNTITGQVGDPAGWTLDSFSSPHGHAALTLTVWEPSETGVFTGLYGMISTWTAQNATTGTQALDMIVPDTHSLQAVTSYAFNRGA
uniref:Uncharacterized protein n=1 Tax=Sulfobacillus thermotolerans TaxID=338644 RepID=G5CJ82_9FIRM|nr:hypothetical protein [Sulfobacillus thermotolerans]